MIEPRGTYRGGLDEALHHRGRGKKTRALEDVDQLDNFSRIEAARFRHDVGRAGENVRQHVESRAMRQRSGMQDRVAWRHRLDVGQEALAHRAQIAVGNDHALRSTRRAARVEEPRRICRGARAGSLRGGAAQKSLVLGAAQARTTRSSGRRIADRRLPSASTKAKRAPLSARMKASSRGCSFALTGTATSPAHQQPNSASTYSVALRETIATRSPGRSPAASNAPAMRAARPASVA